MRNYIIAGVVGLLAIVGIGYFAVGSDDTTNNSTVQVEQPAEEASVGQVDTSAQAQAEVEPQDISTEEQEADQVSQNEELETTTTAQSTPGEYVLYSESAVANADGQKVLFFHASWCPQCLKLEQDIKANGVPSGVTIFEVDYDSNQDLRVKYGVTQQTTTVLIDANGDLVQKYGAYSSPTLASVVSGLNL